MFLSKHYPNPMITMVCKIDGSRMSKQDIPPSLHKWVVVRHMRKSLLELLHFFPIARFPWHQESCSTQDLDHASPIVEESTSFRCHASDHGTCAKSSSEGVSELPSSIDDTEYFGGCMDDLHDGMPILIESLMISGFGTEFYLYIGVVAWPEPMLFFCNTCWDVCAPSSSPTPNLTCVHNNLSA